MAFNTILPTVVAAFAVAIILGVVNRKLSEYNPAGSPSPVGTIKPRKGLVYFGLIACVFFFAFGILATIWLDEMIVYGPACAFMGLCGVVLSIPSLTSIQNLNWNNESLNGPSKVTFSVMGLARKELRWSDIVNVGLVKGGYYYVEGKIGDRIYWSRAYKNFEVFEATLAKKCPTLTLPKYEIHPQ